MRDVGGGFFLGRFFTGASFAASGIGFTFRHRALMLWALIPMLVQFALFVGLFVGGVFLATYVVAHLRPEPGHWYSFLGAVMFVAAIAVNVVASVVGSLFIGSVVCDPFYDKLSEVTEAILVGHSVGTPFSASDVVGGIAREGVVTVMRLAVYGVVALALWAVSLTGVGSVVAVPLSLMWTWMFVALAGWSRSLARHAVPGRRRLAGLFKQPMSALGFGAVGWLLSYIPLTGPFLVVGGTRLYLALAAWDRIESALTDDDKRALREAT